MLQFLSDLPKNVVGIEVNGEVTKDEYDKVVIPRLDDLVKRQGEINYIVVLRTDVPAFTAGAWWDDFKLALKYFTKWNKIAIVTDQKVIEKITDTFSFAFPGESRGFGLDQIKEAVKWVSSKS